MAQDLERRLLDELEDHPSSEVGLGRAYDAVVANIGLADTHALMRQLYSDCEPLPWHSKLAALAWEAIWTFNIDDAIEVAYDRASNRAQRAVTVLPNDLSLPYGGDMEDVPLVHLHGYVGSVDRRAEPALVFSRVEYLDAVHAASKSSWHTRFRGDYPGKPFIIIGARIHDELDLLEVIQQGSLSARFGWPSVIVRPSIDDFERAEYLRWGLIPIEMSGEEFVDYLAGAVADADLRVGAEYTSRYLERVLEEFLPPPLDDEDIPGHDFYGGHAPLWEDIVRELDAVPSWVHQLCGEIGTPEDAPVQQMLYVLHGPPFSGKSTGLLRAARELQKRGWRPIHLVGHERVNPPEVLRYLVDRGNVLLLVDGLANDINDLVQLLATAQAADQRLIILGAERDTHVDHLRRSTPPKFVAGLNTTVFVQPTAALWTGILEKRTAPARLGILEGRPKRDQDLFFVERGRDLYSALASLEDARGFISRGEAAYGLLAQDLRDVFSAVALLAKYGLPTPVALASGVAGIGQRSLLGALGGDGELSDWMRPDERESGVIRLRHGYLGDIVASQKCDDRRSTSLAEISRLICLTVADRVDMRGVRRKTLEARIVRELMDLDAVKFVLRSTEVDDWYASLERAYGWNARYWEQRALGLQESPERAASYARRAVSILRDPFTLNTLGTVLMRRAASTDDAGARLRYWIEAERVLSDSKARAHAEFQHPFVTFFAYSARLVGTATLEDQTLVDAIQLAYRTWYQDCRDAGHLSEVKVRSVADGFPEEWRT